MKNKFLSILLLTLGGLFLTVVNAPAQTPQPSPSPADDSVTFNGYNITSAVEAGFRGWSVDGSRNKFRSDFNYKPGFRIFDSSFRIEDKEKKSDNFFDSLLITSSGWNADPTGFVRLSLEKNGYYRFDSNVRQVVYFNRLNTHALGVHTNDTRHTFGDFDLTIFPQNEKFRLRFGSSFNKTNGDRTYTTRAYSDEFPVSVDSRVLSNDLRGGAEGNLWGFNLSLSHGFRRFKDTSVYFLTAPHPGLTPGAPAQLATFQRNYPIKGNTHFTTFTAQRTFAKKLDFTARVIYAATDTDFQLTELITGRNNTNANVELDRFDISGDSKRSETRGDLGVTYAVTGDFRISDTFTFDTYNITGGNRFAEALFIRNASGTVTFTPTNNINFRVTGYRRFTNTIEADYQFKNWLGINIGYRYTHRRVRLEGFDRPLPPSTANPTFIEEEADNNTNALIAGMKLKPLKNWTIFADVEHGEADNAFTRAANYNFTNFRIRSRWSWKQFAFNLSGISKDNENPSRSIADPTREFIANVKNRMFSAQIDWSPDQKFTFSGGYTYQHLTSETDIVVPVTIGTSNQRLPGISRFLMRDHYAFFDVSAQPFKWVSVYASYRISNDTGEGSPLVAGAQNFTTSYPYRLLSPEARLVFRITKNIDWNVGYQYYGYKEPFQSSQDYRAHLPYTSLRIYFGNATSDR